MHCKTHASSELIVCPGCGRELREAPPKLVTIGAPALLALLLVMLVATQWERVSPITWARSNLVRGVTIVEDISANMDPAVVIVMTPIVTTPIAEAAGENADNNNVDNVENNVEAVAMAAAESPATLAPATDVATTAASADEDSGDVPMLMSAAEESPVGGVGGPNLTGTASSALVEDEAGQEATPTPSMTPWPTMTPLNGPTATPPSIPIGAQPDAKMAGMAGIETEAESPTSTPTPTWTAQPTYTPSNTDVPTAAVTPTSETAGRLLQLPTTASATSGAETARMAPLAATETPVALLSSEPVAGAAAAAIVTPTATASVATTPLPVPTATPVVYQVRSGDTLMSIAAIYDVTVDALMDANSMSEQDVYSIQPGQMLFVPVAELPTPTPVFDAAATEVATIAATTATTAAVTTVAVTATTATTTTGASATASTSSAELRLEAPLLALPANNATVSCATGGKLVWQRVRFVKDSDKYLLHLGFVTGKASDGQEVVTWVVAQPRPVTQTEWDLDTSLCDLAPAEFGHQWRWWVEVVQDETGQAVPVSLPSGIRGFTWN
jgi:LysM repeat protein